MFQRNLILAAGLALCACGTPADKSPGNAPGSLFRYNEAAGITSLDPAFAKDQANIWGVNQLFNGLVQLDHELAIQPCIARSWEVAEGGLLYRFTLRDDVYFHDHRLFSEGKGRKVVASDFVYSFSRIVDDATASPGLWVFQYIARDADGKVQGFSAENDSTLVLRLHKPYPPFLGLLSMPYCSVVPREVADALGRDFGREPVGTGPFAFQVWEDGVRLVMRKNGHYFEKDEKGMPLPYLDAVAVSFIKDKQSAYLEFRKGNFDFISGIDPSYKDELLTPEGTLKSGLENEFYMLTGPYLNTEYLGFLVDENLASVQKSPLRLKKVRQAINMGFDRAKLIRFLRNNIGTPADAGIIPKGMPAYDPTVVRGYTYDPSKASALLAEAGFPGGKGLGEIVLSTNSAYLDLCEAIQAALGEIGVDVKLDVVMPAALRNLVSKSELAFFRASWIADYADGENYLALFYSKNFAPKGPNYTHFSNPGYDALYEAAMLETDPEKRKTLYRQMDQMIVEEAPVVVLYYDQVVRVAHKRVQGLGLNPINLLTLKHVYFNEE